MSAPISEPAVSQHLLTDPALLAQWLRPVADLTLAPGGGVHVQDAAAPPKRFASWSGNLAAHAYQTAARCNDAVPR